MTQDLTKITTPFGLLDEETQEALRAHGGPYHRFNGAEWVTDDGSNFGGWITYRVKPQPPKPIDLWVKLDLATGMLFQRDKPMDGWMHVREVLE